jgi:tRNA pseudouridine38-40 synthase
VGRLRLVIEYDGTDFVGWQAQPRGRSVQGELEAALAELRGRAVRVRAASRTDAGVHAAAQVVQLDWEGRLGPAELAAALNARLPADLAVVGAARTADDFDARRDALAKRYLYRILNRPGASPLRRRVTWQVRSRLDLAAMRRAAALLVGSHDFAAFRGAPGGPPARQSTLRTLDVLHVHRWGDEVRIRAEARSFLRYMVRNLVGTVVEVGQGRRAPDEVGALLAGRDRSRAGPTAPPHGLCLEEVRYPGGRCERLA